MADKRTKPSLLDVLLSVPDTAATVLRGGVKTALGAPGDIWNIGVSGANALARNNPQVGANPIVNALRSIGPTQYDSDYFGRALPPATPISQYQPTIPREEFEPVLENVLGPLALGPVSAAQKIGGRAITRAGERFVPAVQRMQNALSASYSAPGSPAIVYHGSPHKFDKFDSSKIGTGEGAQAYGHGLYLADSPEVAGQYKAALEGKARSSFKTVKGETGTSGIEREAADIAHMMQQYGPVERGWLGRELGARGLPAETAKLVRSYMKGPVQKMSDGALYKVDLPDSAIAKMLDWDKPLSQQPEVRELIRNKFPPTLIDGRMVNPADSPLVGRALLDQLSSVSNKRGAPGMRAAEPALQTAGIPGIRYLDGGSRGSGSGTSNYVVFPGEENALTILERNGLRLQGPINKQSGKIDPRLLLGAGTAAATAYGGKAAYDSIKESQQQMIKRREEAIRRAAGAGQEPPP
jgi:hypothetical protein